MSRLSAPLRIRIHGGTVLPMTTHEPVLEKTELCVDGDSILSVGHTPDGFQPERSLDAAGCWVLPGFVQGHVHLVQTLLRGIAEDLALLPWLERFIWPGEAHQDDAMLRVSARLGLAELIRGGTTTIVDMGTVHGHAGVCDEIFAAGITAITGKAMMDHDPEGRAPERLREDTRASIDESLALARHVADMDDEGRLHYAFAPRFALSCTRDLLEEVGRLARDGGHGVHTHACENLEEIAAVEAATGMSNIQYLDACGLLSHRTIIAHGIHLAPGDEDRLAARRSTIAHCPAANLKLGSGVARIAHLIECGIPITLGADGAPCNNRLDAFRELYLTAALSKLKSRPDALPAAKSLALLTRDGARAIGLGAVCGTLEPGKRSDIVGVRKDALSMTPTPDVYTALVYGGSVEDVRTVIAGGRLLKHDGRLLVFDEEEVSRHATEQARVLAGRMP